MELTGNVQLINDSSEVYHIFCFSVCWLYNDYVLLLLLFIIQAGKSRCPHHAGERTDEAVPKRQHQVAQGRGSPLCEVDGYKRGLPLLHHPPSLQWGNCAALAEDRYLSCYGCLLMHTNLNTTLTFVQHLIEYLLKYNTNLNIYLRLHLPEHMAKQNIHYEVQ